MSYNAALTGIKECFVITCTVYEMLKTYNVTIEYITILIMTNLQNGVSNTDAIIFSPLIRLSKTLKL